MTNRKQSRADNLERRKKNASNLSLKIESSDRRYPRIDAQEFLTTAEKWLRALNTFAVERGERVKWEIVDLRKSSALIEVQPVKLKTNKPFGALVKDWDEGLRRMERTGRPAPKFTSTSLVALKEFVSSVPKDSIVSIGNGTTTTRLHITALTQSRVQEAAQRLPQEQKREYAARGSIRGRLAVLDSWKPEDRSFSLQLPLAPNRPVKCTYGDTSLVTELSGSFEGIVEITGNLRYKPDQAWPYSAEVEHIRPLRTPGVALRDLVGLIHLPEGQDSISYVRSVRDAE